MDKRTANYLIEQNKKLYNKIATDFDRKRKFITRDLLYLGKYINQGDRVLDVGCSNGRFYEVVRSRGGKYWGIDIAENMLAVARKKYPKAKFFLSEQFSFPFGSNFFDKVFCLSVFHHIPSGEFRERFLKEIKRVLKPGGEIILTVWNLRERKKTKKLLFKYIILKLIGKTDLDFYDIFLPWKDSNGNIKAIRYIHAFSKRELVRLFRKAGFRIEKIEIIYRSKTESNILIIAKK